MPDDEVEQHLTVSATGRVWFTGYHYGAGLGGYTIGRRQQLSIGKEAACKLLSLISTYYEQNEIQDFATDIGDWTLNITDTAGNKYSKSGSMCGGVTTGSVDLTDYIREAVGITDLAVFDGDTSEDEDDEE